MLIRVGYDIRFDLPAAVPMTALLSLHPSRRADLRGPDTVQVEPGGGVTEFTDLFGNISTRFTAGPGAVRLHCQTVVEDSGAPDAVNVDAGEVPIGELPPETLRYLMASRYCEVDLLAPIALDLFGGTPRGYRRVQAVCDWVHSRVTFNYGQARPTRTALDVLTERVGVCRDFQHLAVAFCRALNIPARYTAGYLGDIGVPAAPTPMDFSAWFEAYLEGGWWTFDARHNRPRIGRVLLAAGLDATDVAITTSFGSSRLTHFEVVTEEVTGA